MKDKDVAVVMITKNEEKSVRKVISDIKKYVPGAEILLVDSSADKTPQIAKKMGARVIRQYPPKGYGPAMMKALSTPKKDIIVTMDCDNTYPANIIPKLIKKINQGYDLVGTTRVSSKKSKHMRLENYLANKMFNWFASLVFLRQIHDVHSGMRAYRKDLIHKIKWNYRPSALPVELLLKPIRLGYQVIEIPIVYKQRLGETTLDRFNSGIWTFRRIISSRRTKLVR